MADDDSVSEWVGQIKNGDEDAAQKLWERYFRRLVGLARKRLPGNARGDADEQDVALNALASVFRAFEEGRFHQLNDRDGLWRLLVTVTVRKAEWQRRHATGLKRGGGAAPAREVVLEDVVDGEPTPEDAAEVADECRRLLSRLRDPDLEGVARDKMEGYTNAEIAARRHCALRAIERRIKLIRRIWQENTS
jgi:DNA-directed RNA polymerase specialized sigma24 family protein